MQTPPNHSELVFQEAKKIDGSHYIASIYDSMRQKALIVTLFGLDTEGEYNTILSYAEFEDLFKFNASLLVPGNRNARYHHLIERLVFGIDDFDEPKKLVIGGEPSMDDDCDDVPESPRAELDLLSSESVRQDFLDDVRARQELQELRSRQRLLRLHDTQTVPVTRDSRNLASGDILVAQATAEPNTAQTDRRRDKSKKRVGNGVRSSVFVATNENRPLGIETRPSEQSASLCALPGVLADALRRSCVEITARRQAALDVEEGREVRLRSARDAKLFDMRQAALIRAQEREMIETTQLNLETKRKMSIQRKETEKHAQFASLVHANRLKASIDAKQRSFRNQEARTLVMEQSKEQIIEKFRRIKDQAKLQALRDRNVDIKVQVRQRRLKESSWLKERSGADSELERLGLNDPKQNCNASTIESVKTYKTGSSSNMSKNLKMQEELVREKQEFIARVEREERVNEKLANKPSVRVHKTPSEIEVERFQVWKTGELDRRNRILATRLALMDQRVREVQQRLEDSRSAERRHRDLEEKRQRHWNIQDDERKRVVIEDAISRVSCVAELVPHLLG